MVNVRQIVGLRLGEFLSQRGLEPWRLVFFDESGSKSNNEAPARQSASLAPTARSSPCGLWQNATMISSIRLDGSAACMHLSGAADIAAFVAYIGLVLSPHSGKVTSW